MLDKDVMDIDRGFFLRCILSRYSTRFLFVRYVCTYGGLHTLA